MNLRLIKIFFTTACFFGISNVVFAQLNPLLIGNLEPNDSVMVYYDVTINAACGCSQISNQGSVAGSNFATVNSDDPDTAPVGDATITLLDLFVVPVNFLSLQAAEKEKTIEVSWAVSSEINMLKYEVEKRGENGFSKIGEILSVNSTVPFTYSFTDGKPAEGTNYYRIYMINADGTGRYSNIVKANTGSGQPGFVLFPNPVKDKKLNIQLYDRENGSYRVELHNSAGHLVFIKNIYYAGGTAFLQLELPKTIAAGVYNLKIMNGNFAGDRMIIVE